MWSPVDNSVKTESIYLIYWKSHLFASKRYIRSIFKFKNSDRNPRNIWFLNSPDSQTLHRLESVHTQQSSQQPNFQQVAGLLWSRYPLDSRIYLTPNAPFVRSLYYRSSTILILSNLVGYCQQMKITRPYRIQWSSAGQIWKKTWNETSFFHSLISRWLSTRCCARWPTDTTWVWYTGTSSQPTCWYTLKR